MSPLISVKTIFKMKIWWLNWQELGNTLQIQRNEWGSGQGVRRPLLSILQLIQFSSVARSCLSLCDPMDMACQATLSITNSGAYSNSCPSSWWYHPTISSSVIPFSSRLQSFPVSGSFQMSQLFASGGQIIGVSALTSVLPMHTQNWSPLGWTGWISLQSKGLSRVFSNTTVQKHQFFSTQLYLESKSHTHTWLLEKP